MQQPSPLPSEPRVNKPPPPADPRPDPLSEEIERLGAQVAKINGVGNKGGRFVSFPRPTSNWGGDFAIGWWKTLNPPGKPSFHREGNLYLVRTLDLFLVVWPVTCQFGAFGL